MFFKSCPKLSQNIKVLDNVSQHGKSLGFFWVGKEWMGRDVSFTPGFIQFDEDFINLEAQTFCNLKQPKKAGGVPRSVISVTLCERKQFAPENGYF